MCATFLLASGAVIRAYELKSDSMAPQLPKGTHVMVRPGRDATRGDVIAFRVPHDPKSMHAKRVVAIGGDTVEIRDKRLLVNGKEVAEPYVAHADPQTHPAGEPLPEPYRSRDQFGPVTVQTESFFVLGDNRDHSFDSRYFGAVPRANVVGRVVATYSIRGIRRIDSPHQLHVRGRGHAQHRILAEAGAVCGGDLLHGAVEARVARADDLDHHGVLAPAAPLPSRAPDREAAGEPRLDHFGDERIELGLLDGPSSRDGEPAKEPVGDERVLRAGGDEKRDGGGGDAHGRRL